MFELCLNWRRVELWFILTAVVVSIISPLAFADGGTWSLDSTISSARWFQGSTTNPDSVNTGVARVTGKVMLDTNDLDNSVFSLSIYPADENWGHALSPEGSFCIAVRKLNPLQDMVDTGVDTRTPVLLQSWDGFAEYEARPTQIDEVNWHPADCSGKESQQTFPAIGRQIAAICSSASTEKDVRSNTLSETFPFTLPGTAKQRGQSRDNAPASSTDPR